MMRKGINQYPRPPGAKPVIRVLIITAAVLGVIAIAGLGADLRINMTPSEPLGLWRIRPLGRKVIAGDVVFICPPETELMRLARDRGYFRGGLCSGGYAPLIKTIAATAGQHVAIGRSVSIDGVPLLQSTLIARDGKGRPLAPYPGGTVPPGEVFLYSPFVGSYDSRYFGPLPAAGILGLAEEVFTYAP